MSSTRQQVTIVLFVVGIVLVVVVVVAGTIGYQRMYRPLLRPLGFVSAAGKLEGSLRNTAPFTPQHASEVSPDQWRRFCDVESAVQTALNSAMDTLSTQRDAILATTDRDTGQVPFHTALAAIGAIGSAFIKAKAAQVDAMNRVDLSLEEFQWVRRQAYASVGLPLAELALDRMRSAAQDRLELVDVRTFPARLPEASEEVRRLQAERRALLTRWSALAFFGL